MVTYIVGLKKDGPLHEWEIPYFIRNFYDQLFKTSERCYIIREGKYELKNFTPANEPLRMVSKTVREGLTENTVFRRKAWEYRTYRIQEIQGLSFKEWMELTPPIQEQLLTDIRKEEEHRRLIAKQDNNNIDRMTGGDLTERMTNQLLGGSKF